MGKKVNQTELALILGVTDVTIWEWQKVGMPVLSHGERGKANEYDSSAVIAWKIETEVAKVRKESPRDALYLAQRELVDIQVAEKRRALVPVEEAENEFARMVTLARQRFLQMPGLLQLDDQQRILLTEAVEEALKELSSYDPSATNHLSASNDPAGGAAVGASSAPVGGGVGGGKALPE